MIVILFNFLPTLLSFLLLAFPYCKWQKAMLGKALQFAILMF